MSTKQTNGSGRFPKGTSGNPSGRPPGSRNHATVLMESLLEGEAEQLTRKAIELALGGDITALRLCLERLVPPRKDRAIHLDLAPIENVQQVSRAMAGVFTAIAEGKITPMEVEVLSSILAAHKAVLVTGSLELRVDELEKRMSQQQGGAAPSPSAVLSGSPGVASGVGMNLANRLKRLEQRMGRLPRRFRSRSAFGHGRRLSAWRN